MKLIHKIAAFDAPASVATIGFFDGVHTGHQALLRRLKEKSVQLGIPSIVITFSEHPRTLLHPNYVPRLLTTNEERLARLEDLGVDYCLMLKADRNLFDCTSDYFIRHTLRENLRVAHLLVGHDHHLGCDREHGFEYYQQSASQCGMEVELIAAYTLQGHPVSSSLIRKELEAGHVEEATRYLGSPYTMEGYVVHGHALGRTLGLPTANIAVGDVRKVIPGFGVYVVEARIENEAWWLPGVLNIGTRPTLHELRPARSIELHLLHFDEDLYRKKVRFRLISFLREEHKFDSLSDLSAQIAQDKQSAENYFKG